MGCNMQGSDVKRINSAAIVYTVNFAIRKKIC